MPDLADILERIWDSLARVAAPRSNLYWLYFLSAAGMAFVIYWLRRYDKGDASVRGFFNFCFPGRIYAHPSARLDFKYVAINAVLYGGLIAPLVLTSAAAAHGTVAVMVGLFGVPSAPLPAGVWADLGMTIAAVVAADLAFFAAHYLEHRVAFLWEFHKVHHASEVLQPLTLYRVHPVDTVLDATFMGAATGGVLGLAAYLFGDALEGVTILGTNAAVFLFNFGGVHLRHSHVPLSYGYLDRILMSPSMHQAHHSCAPEHLGKNIGGMLSTWDRLAGTIYIPHGDEELILGLAGGEHRDYDSVADLYLLPFAKNARRLRRHLGGGRAPDVGPEQDSAPAVQQRTRP